MILQIYIDSPQGLFNPDNIIWYDGFLFERLERVKGGPKYKYRLILSEDHYDYVTDPFLKKELDRAFKKRWDREESTRRWYRQARGLK